MTDSAVAARKEAITLPEMRVQIELTRPLRRTTLMGMEEAMSKERAPHEAQLYRKADEWPMRLLPVQPPLPHRARQARHLRGARESRRHAVHARLRHADRRATWTRSRRSRSSISCPARAASPSPRRAAISSATSARTGRYRRRRTLGHRGDVHPAGADRRAPRNAIAARASATPIPSRRSTSNTRRIARGLRRDAGLRNCLRHQRLRDAGDGRADGRA